MESKSEKSRTYRIWVAGDYDSARQIVREYCYEIGDCYSVIRSDFIYTGGEESGLCITRINYPRFPATPDEINGRALELATRLCHTLCQQSFTIEGPETTTYYRKEKEND